MRIIFKDYFNAKCSYCYGILVNWRSSSNLGAIPLQSMNSSPSQVHSEQGLFIKWSECFAGSVIGTALPQVQIYLYSYRFSTHFQVQNLYGTDDRFSKLGIDWYRFSWLKCSNLFLSHIWQCWKVFQFYNNFYSHKINFNKGFVHVYESNQLLG